MNSKTYKICIICFSLIVLVACDANETIGPGILKYIRQNASGDYVLSSDIILIEAFEPLPEFNGTLDGRGYSIRGLRIAAQDRDDVGLFSRIGINGVVQNLVIEPVGSSSEEASISGDKYTGALAGHNYGRIENVIVRGGSVSGSFYVGALVGKNEGRDAGISRTPTILESKAYAEVRGFTYVGGLVGGNNGDIISSQALGSVEGIARFYTDGNPSHSLGGLVGFNGDSSGMRVAGGEHWGLIERSSATGSVTGENSVGGIVGQNSGTITMSYYAGGEVSGEEEVGGFVGRNHYQVSKSYATGSVVGISNVGGFVGSNYTIVASLSSGSVEYIGAVEECYSVSRVSRKVGHREDRIGGFAGSNEENTHSNGVTLQASIASSYFDTDLSTRQNAIGENTGSEDVILLRALDIDRSTFKGWIFSGIDATWQWIALGSWPILKWQDEDDAP